MIYTCKIRFGLPSCTVSATRVLPIYNTQLLQQTTIDRLIYLIVDYYTLSSQTCFLTFVYYCATDSTVIIIPESAMNTTLNKKRVFKILYILFFDIEFCTENALICYIFSLVCRSQELQIT